MFYAIWKLQKTFLLLKSESLSLNQLKYDIYVLRDKEFTEKALRD